MTTDTRFHTIVVPHLAAGRRLARWLVHNDHDADDIVQEAALRAFRYFGSFSGDDGRAWFLRIVRNLCCGWYGRRGPVTAGDPFDEESHSHLRPSTTPETLLLRTDDATRVARAMTHLSERARELLRLREVEGLSYRELAEAMDIPMGTVMSGLARARRALRRALAVDGGDRGRLGGEYSRGLED